MKVYHTPVLPHRNEVAPVIRQDLTNGFSIQQGNAKGTWLPKLADAVNDWNRTIAAAFPGISDAAFSYWLIDELRRVDTYNRPQSPMPDLVENDKDEQSPEERCACPACKAYVEELKETGRPPTTGLLVAAMLASIFGPEVAGRVFGEETATVANYDPACAEMLLKTGFARKSSFGITVAIPEELGSAFGKQLKAAIEARNVAAVSALVTGRKGPFA